MAGYISGSYLSQFMHDRMQITASSVPGLDVADILCDQIGDELNAAALRGGWNIPIPSSATVAFGVMQLYNRYGAGWQYMTQRLGSGNDQGGPVSTAADYRAAYMNALKGLELGTLALPGAPQADASQRVLPGSNSSSADPCCNTGSRIQSRKVTRCTEF